jgi:hypothetical protein
VVVAELNALGLNYTLSSGAGKRAKTAPAKEKGNYPGRWVWITQPAGRRSGVLVLR